MDDLNRYSIAAIYQMMRDGTIGLEDLSRYISEVVPNMEASEELMEFLETANNYIDRRIRHAVEQQENVTEEQPRQIDEETVRVESPEMVSDNTSTSSDDDQSTKIEQPVEQQEQMVEEEPGVEVPASDDVVEEVAPPNEYPYLDSDGNSLEEAQNAMNQTYNYCQDAGMTISDISLSGKAGRGPYISFEINNESKQYLDHLMTEFFQNSEGISLEFMRNMSTKSEMFTIEIDPTNVSQEEFFVHVKETFEQIYKTVETTRRDYDYEKNMPEGLKNVKDHFVNDDPDIGQDFTIGYVRNDGKDSYYIVADDEEAAIAYAQSIGYDIKNREGANVFEIETNGSVVGTKLEDASVDLANDRDILNFRDNGVSTLDVYGSLETDPKVEMIENFIETSNDPHMICLLDIEVPPENTDQRVVKLKDSGSTNEVVVFTDGEEFDKKVLPKIVDTYAENNHIEHDNITISGGNRDDSVSCQIESENDTTMTINGYSQEEIDTLVTNIENKAKDQASQEAEKNSVRQKTIGTYQPNNSSDNDSTNQSSAFVSMPVLFVICVLFVLMISLIIFAR